MRASSAFTTPAWACITTLIWRVAISAHLKPRCTRDYRRFEWDAARLALAGNIAAAATCRRALPRSWDATTDIACAGQASRAPTNERWFGQASPDEVLGARAGLRAEQTRAEQPALRKQLQQTEHLLAVLAGRAPGAGGVLAFTLSDYPLYRSATDGAFGVERAPPPGYPGG